LVTPPTLSIAGDDTALLYRQDFVEYPGHYRNLGLAQGPLHLVMMEDLTILGDWNQKIPALEDLNYEDEVILVLDQKDLRFVQSIPRQGILVVADDPINLQRRFTLSNRDPHYMIYGSQNVRGQDTPMLWISQDLADSLLEGTGYNVKQLREIDANLDQDDLRVLEAVLAKHIRYSLEQFKEQENDDLLKECRERSGDESLDHAGASVFVLRELWKRLKETHRLRMVKKY